MEIVEINSIQELDDLRPVWQRLWQSMSGASFFHSLEWLEAAWHHARVDQSLRVVVVGGCERPIGILPLVVRREPRRLGTVRVLTYPLSDWGPFYCPISDRPAETLRAGLEYIVAMPRNWDLLDLRWTAAGDSDPAKSALTLASLGLPYHTRLRHQTSIIDLEGSWDDYVAARSKNWRSHFRRRCKRFKQAGDVRYERYRPLGEKHGEANPRWDLYETCVELAAKSWQGTCTTGNTLNHASVRDLLRAAHKEAARLGCLDLNLLYLDNRPISFAYNYFFQGHVFALRVGYDPTMKKLGPGSMVEELAIEDSFARGDHLYELGPDAEESKRQLRTRLEPIWQHTHYSRLGLRPQLMRCKSAVESWWERASAGIGLGRPSIAPNPL